MVEEHFLCLHLSLTLSLFPPICLYMLFSTYLVLSRYGFQSAFRCHYLSYFIPFITILICLFISFSPICLSLFSSPSFFQPLSLYILIYLSVSSFILLLLFCLPFLPFKSLYLPLFLTLHLLLSLLIPSPFYPYFSFSSF